MHGLCLGPYLGGEGMYQNSENMLSFQMTPSNYQYVIFMWAKCLQRETVWQTKFPRLAYKLVDITDSLTTVLRSGIAEVKQAA